jgi:uncharacterized protein (DUF342 family)
MNPLIKSYLDRMEDEIGQVRELLQGATQELQRQKEAREKLLHQFWARGKEIAVLNEATRTYAQLQEENRELRGVQQELQNGLERVLGQTKVLAEALRQ